jgi:hypothetical protein
MARSWLRDGTPVALFLLLSAVIPISRFYGQDKPEIAPPAKSDSYAEDEKGRKIRVQQREVPGTNFKIAGVDLAASGDFFNQVFGILGDFDIAESGDASTALREACYRSVGDADPTILILGEGEVDQSFTLSSDGSAWKWKSPCRKTSKITRDLPTASGLRLGQTQEQVIAVLGLPTRRSRNFKNGWDDLAYELEAKKRMSSKELAPYLQDALKEHPNLDQRNWIKEYGFYDLSVSIEAKFLNDKLTTLKVDWSETY